MNDNEEFILKLHNGETVETIELGGISATYENAIQGLFIDMILILHKKKIPEEKKDITKILNHVANTCISKLKYKYSYAQVEVAKDFTFFVWRDGINKCIENMRVHEESRIIKMDKYGLINYIANETT